MRKTEKLSLFLLVALTVSSCVKEKDMFIKPGEITSFKFEKSKNPQLSKDIVMEIYPESKRITGYLTENVDVSSLVATFSTERSKLLLNNIPQESGKTANNFNQTIQYAFTGDDQSTTYFKVTIVPYTGLPVVTIRTEKETMVKSKEIWMNASITINGMGKMENTSDSATVKGRGNGSWAFPKKPFNVKLNTKAGVLDMPKQKNWSFLANYRDRTLLRNDVTLHLGQMADNLLWTPKCQSAEVIFNGEYQGNFLICERIKVDKNRVNIKEMTSDDIDEETITGGYIFEYTRYDEPNKYTTPINKWPIAVKEPDEDVLVKGQMEYAENYNNTVEQLLNAGNFELLYEKYIDINSFVDYWIIQTLSGNLEPATYGSVYCTKDRNKKMYAGPMWDFDYSTYVKTSGTDHKNTIWYKYLFKDTAFKNKIKARFSILKPQFETVPDYIASKAQYLTKSAATNWEIWSINISVLNGYTNGDETLPYQESIDRMISIYQARLAWLEQEINKL